MSEMLFSLPQFEGPLDVLLHLISKHKLNLYDINLALLVDQYIAFMEQKQQFDLELTGDFLEMASRLVYLKSVMLLPKHEEEKQQLKAELEGQLIEYQTCKRMAQLLKERFDRTNVYVRNPLPGIIDTTYRRTHQPTSLADALLALQIKLIRKQAPPKTSFTGIVSKRVVSVSSRIIFVLRALTKKSAVTFDSLFDKTHEKTEHVATFMAVLELIKGKRIRISDEGGIQLQTKKGR